MNKFKRKRKLLRAVKKYNESDTFKNKGGYLYFSSQILCKLEAKFLPKLYKKFGWERHVVKGDIFDGDKISNQLFPNLDIYENYYWNDYWQSAVPLSIPYAFVPSAFWLPSFAFLFQTDFSRYETIGVVIHKNSSDVYKLLCGFNKACKELKEDLKYINSQSANYLKARKIISTILDESEENDTCLVYNLFDRRIGIDEKKKANLNYKWIVDKNKRFLKIDFLDHGVLEFSISKDNKNLFIKANEYELTINLNNDVDASVQEIRDWVYGIVKAFKAESDFSIEPVRYFFHKYECEDVIKEDFRNQLNWIINNPNGDNLERLKNRLEELKGEINNKVYDRIHSLLYSEHIKSITASPYFKFLTLTAHEFSVNLWYAHYNSYNGYFRFQVGFGSNTIIIVFEDNDKLNRCFRSEIKEFTDRVCKNLSVPTIYGAFRMDTFNPYINFDTEQTNNRWVPEPPFGHRKLTTDKIAVNSIDGSDFPDIPKFEIRVIDGKIAIGQMGYFDKDFPYKNVFKADKELTIDEFNEFFNKEVASKIYAADNNFSKSPDLTVVADSVNLYTPKIKVIELIESSVTVEVTKSDGSLLPDYGILQFSIPPKKKNGEDVELSIYDGVANSRKVVFKDYKTMSMTTYQFENWINKIVEINGLPTDSWRPR